MQELRAGDRVLVIGWPYRGGVQGTLLRPGRVLWKRAWIVEFDKRPRGGWKRDRVVETQLLRLPIA